MLTSHKTVLEDLTHAHTCVRIWPVQDSTQPITRKYASRTLLRSFQKTETRSTQKIRGVARTLRPVANAVQQSVMEPQLLCVVVADMQMNVTLTCSASTDLLRMHTLRHKS